jgi:uncharacterized protein (DUF1778 family)
MATNTMKKEKARFDTRLTKEQKLFFERAATIGGFRSLSEFIIWTVQEKAREIIREEESVLASQRDSEIFFNAMVNADKPNSELISAAEQYNKTVSK